MKSPPPTNILEIWRLEGVPLDELLPKILVYLRAASLQSNVGEPELRAL